MRFNKILTRDLTNRINWVLDNLLPPFVRDSKLFMKGLFWILFKDKSSYFFEFKEKAHQLTEKEYQEYYKILADCHIQRKTDLNRTSISRILELIKGDRVLDIACGGGYLSRLIYNERGGEVTGIDIEISGNSLSSPGPVFEIGNVERIEYPDRYFDTVICAHTLEHVQNINTAVEELRRVTKRRLIIIVPCQREYRYTFDLHLHFFPYSYKLMQLMGNKGGGTIKKYGNDFFYMENVS